MIQKDRYEHELYEARLKAQLDENSRNRWYERIERNYRESQENLQRAQEQLAAATAAATAAAAEAAAQAKLSEEAGRLRGQIELLERFLKLPATPAETLQKQSITELEAHARELQARWDKSGSN